MMLNSLESYADIGRKVARATNQNDGHARAFYMTHFHAMRMHENAEGYDAATKAYNEAYTEARRVGRH